MTDHPAETDMLTSIRSEIQANPIMIFMKGNPTFPRCGFSAAVVEIFEQMGVKYGAMDILPDPRIRQVLSGHSNWPTIPQVFIRGEFIGGCDIVRELDANGELKKLVEAAIVG